MNAEVKSAVRVLDLLELFSVAPEPMGVSEVSRLMAIPKSSAQALLTTLVARGYLEKNAIGYALNVIHQHHGWVGGSLARLRKIAVPVMERLTVETDESAFLSILAPNLEMKYIAKVVSPNVVRYDAPLTNTRPAYCVSSGLAFLASFSDQELSRYFESVHLERKAANTPTNEKAVRGLLEKTRKQGYAELFDSHVDGASGVSALILDELKKPIASLTLVGPTARFTKSLPMMREKVIEAALEMGERIWTTKPRSAS